MCMRFRNFLTIKYFAKLNRQRTIAIDEINPQCDVDEI